MALVVECKSSEGGNRRPDFDADLSKLAKNRDHARTYWHQETEHGKNFKVGAIYVVDGVSLPKADLDRAKNDKILVLDRRAISYYITLAKRIKEAAKYQLFAEVFEGQTVDNLKLVVPAVQASMGKRRVYHFALTPASLLKIAFVAHRAESDVATYQRLVEPKRLESIREYIDQGGVFPTSIVVNFAQETYASGRPKELVFSPFEKGESTEDSRVGLLTLPRLYQSAWIIDGQHRLLAYAGHRWASTATLAVTAFEGLEADKQADLFVQINSEQKKVPASHLEALIATIRWSSKDEQQQVRAIISRMAQELRKDPQSPLYGRIVLPDEQKTPVRCVTLSTMAEALKRRGFFLEPEIKGKVRHYGPLWAFDPAKTLNRTKSVVNSFFGEIRLHNQEQWEQGSPSGGLVATNLGVGACLRVLLEVLRTFKSQIPRFDEKATDELNALLLPYARAIGEYLATLTEEESKAICAGRYGVGAPIVPSYYMGQAIREAGLSLEYKELDQWHLDQSVSRDGDVLQKLNDVVRRVKQSVLAELVHAYGEEGWWWEVPLDVRQEVGLPPSGRPFVTRDSVTNGALLPDGGRAKPDRRPEEERRTRPVPRTPRTSGAAPHCSSGGTPRA